MASPGMFKNWLRLPSRIGLLLGFGALSAAGANTQPAEAHLGKEPSRVPQQSAKQFGELRIWSDAGRIFIAEAGKPAQELPLGDTAEARRLRELLERGGANSDSPRVLLEKMILVGGGGEGFHWAPADRNKAPDAPPTPAGAGDNPAAAGFAPAPPPASGQHTVRPEGWGQSKAGSRQKS